MHAFGADCNARAFAVRMILLNADPGASLPSRLVILAGHTQDFLKCGDAFARLVNADHAQ